MKVTWHPRATFKNSYFTTPVVPEYASICNSPITFAKGRRLPATNLKVNYIRKAIDDTFLKV